MKNQSGRWTELEAAAVAIGIGAFFFDLVGVFGLFFASASMLILVAFVVAICLKAVSSWPSPTG